MEALNYFKKRQLRFFNYYKGKAQALLRQFMRTVVFSAVVVRLLCIAIDLDVLIRAILPFFGLGSYLTQTRARYSTITGMYSGTDQGYWSDYVAMFTLRRGL